MRLDIWKDGYQQETIKHCTVMSGNKGLEEKASRESLGGIEKGAAS